MTRAAACRPERDLAGVAARAWDVIVIGAGPAGSVAARDLASRGLAVLLVDKAAFPREKVCGCCLNAAAVGTLRRLGLGGVLRDSMPLERVDLAAGGARAGLRLGGGVALSRGVLDSRLAAEAVAAGVVFVEGVGARVTAAGGGGCEVELRRGAELAGLRVRAVVAADGLGGTSLAGLGAFEPRVRRESRVGAGVVLEGEGVETGTVLMTCGPGGYVGMVRLEDGRVDVAASLDLAAMRRAGGPGPVVQGILRSAAVTVPPGLDAARWRGTPALTRRRRVEGDGVFVIGDAAGYVEPFTGEGMAWAVACGEVVAPVVAAAVAGEAAAGEWAAIHRRLVGGRQRVCGLVAGVLRAPWAVEAGLRVLAGAPVLSAPLRGLVDRPWTMRPEGGGA